MLLLWCRADWRRSPKGILLLSTLCLLLVALETAAVRSSLVLELEMSQGFAQGAFAQSRSLERRALLSENQKLLDVQLFTCEHFQGLTLVKGRWPLRGEVVVERSSLPLLDASGKLGPYAIVGQVFDPTQAPGQMDRCVYLYTSGTPVGRILSSPARHPHADHLAGVLFVLKACAFLILGCGCMVMFSLSQRRLASLESEIQLMRYLGANWNQLRLWMTVPLLLPLLVATSLGWLLSWPLGENFVAFARAQLNLEPTTGHSWGRELLLGLIPFLLLGSAIGVSLLRHLKSGDGLFWSKLAPAPAWFARLPIQLALAWGGLVQRRGRLLLCWLTLSASMILAVVALTVASSAGYSIERAIGSQPWNCEIIGLGKRPSPQCWGWQQRESFEELHGSREQLALLPLAWGRLPKAESDEYLANPAEAARGPRPPECVGLVREIGPARRYFSARKKVAEGWLWGWNGQPQEVVERVRELSLQGSVLVQALEPDQREVAAAQHLHIFVIMLLGLSVFVATLGGLTLAGHLKSSLGERKTDGMAIWAMGASPGWVRRSLLAESATLLGLSGLSAILGGIPLGFWIARSLLESSLHIACALVVPVPGLLVGGALCVALTLAIQPADAQGQTLTPAEE